MGGCAAFNCTNSTEKGKRTFHFPRDPDRRKQWAISCRRAHWNPTNCSVLCEDHFEEDQYENKRADGRKLLKYNAIPTKFNIPNPPKKNGKRILVYQQIAGQQKRDENREIPSIFESSSTIS